ncbi:hypothetical protein BLOT_006737 [Blomia tropicalis]|nr:hypothetical protein BLOT_006737 [Blomia tropicalis]
MNLNLRNEVAKRCLDLGANFMPVQSIENVFDQHSNETINLNSIIKSIKSDINEIRKRSEKNFQVAKSYYLEAELKFKLFTQNEPINKTWKQRIELKEELDSIHKLINLAIVHYPIDSKQELAAAFALRSIAHGHYHKHKLAMEAIEVAIKLNPNELLYETYKIKHLIDSNNWNEAFDLVKTLKRKCNTDKFMTKLLNKLLIEIQARISHKESRCSPTAIEDDDCLFQADENDWHIDDDYETENSTKIKLNLKEKHNFDFNYGCHIETDRNKGRKMVVSENVIEQDALLFNEQPYSVILSVDQLLNRCHNCYRNVSRSFWPCSNCTIVVYCNEQCQIDDWSFGGHQWECRFTRHLMDQSINLLHTFQIMNRIGLDAIDQMNCNVEQNHLAKLVYYMNDSKQRHIPERSKDFLIREQAYKTFQSLDHHLEKVEKNLIVKYLIDAIDCVIFSYIIQEYDFDHNRLIHLIHHCFFNIGRIQINSFIWTEMNSSNGKYDKVAVCVCLLSSLFNHSCNPNAFWYFNEGQFRLQSIRPILKGEEITISYGTTQTTHKFETRQRANLRYFFQCGCSACLEESVQVLALQCKHCSGPVMVNQVIYNHITNYHCLQCSKPYSNVEMNRNQLIETRKHLHLMVNVANFINIFPNYLDDIKQLLNRIISLCYNQSNLLINDIFMFIIKTKERQLAKIPVCSKEDQNSTLKDEIKLLDSFNHEIQKQVKNLI